MNRFRCLLDKIGVKSKMMEMDNKWNWDGLSCRFQNAKSKCIGAKLMKYANLTKSTSKVLSLETLHS